MKDLLRETGEWYPLLKGECKQPYFKALSKHVQDNSGILAPSYNRIFRALRLCQPEDVKVVVIGQDPYPTEGHANGLAFAVNKDIRVPPSLRNIFVEVEDDLGEVKTDRTLKSWTKQGVMLLNTVLTTEVGKTGAHLNLGWTIFTDKVIEILNEQHCIFLCWGMKAQAKRHLIDSSNILCANHPSPFSARFGFFGCRHFSQTNARLKKAKRKPIDW